MPYCAHIDYTRSCYAHSPYHTYNWSQSREPTTHSRNSSQRTRNSDEYYERVETTRTTRNNFSGVQSDSNNRLRRTSGIKCSKCLGHGHYSRDCTNRSAVFINSDGQYEFEDELVTFKKDAKEICGGMCQELASLQRLLEKFFVASTENTKEECAKPMQIDQVATHESQDEEEEIPILDDDLTYGEPGEILSLEEESPKVVPQPSPEASSCETPQSVDSSVQKEESKEEEIVQHPSVDFSAIEQQSSRNIQTESPMEIPQNSPMINKDDLAIVHPVLPEQLPPHLIQREVWPQNFLYLKEFPQSGNSILTIQIGEPLRVLQYLNDGTNNFELLAEIQVLPSWDAHISSTIINNMKIDEQSPEIFQGGGNNAIIPETDKGDTWCVREQPPMLFSHLRDVRRFGGAVQGFLIKEPFQESGYDEVITSLPGEGVHPARIDPPLNAREVRELRQLVQFRAYCFKGGTF